ncbi:uncharacterized protein LOC126661236 [Mercurialis annua]|uniref:uncharacterized protein LOC126661236 n=1 Tax=Mercurialis annua TaxID=3986 RepID=UPI00215E7E2C|nr:uncharacterized protein LOC126661236 [Mercurialis annua]
MNFTRDLNKKFSSYCFSVLSFIRIRSYSTQRVVGHPTTKNFSSNDFVQRDFSRHCRPLRPQIYDGSSLILQSSCLQPWFKKWQEQRKNKLTASTFAGAIGFWRGRRVKLWLEKLGAVESFSDNIATCWSNMKEKEALEKYELLTGHSVSFPEFQVYGLKNSDDDWLAASPDGVIDSRGVLEIKCPYFKGDKRRFSPCKRIPLYYIPQAQGLMEILNLDWMDFYVWTPAGSSLFRINRDVEYWNILKLALSDFWWKNVQPAREIYSKAVIKDPQRELKLFKPSRRHELYGDIVYKSKHIVDSSKLLWREKHWQLYN